MNIQEKIFIIVALIAAVLFLSYPASAESGSILISDDKVYTYSLTNGYYTGSCTFSTILFDNANYNYLSSFWMHLSTGTFAKESATTRFTITSGGSGGGQAYYLAELRKFYWVFDTNTLITAGQIGVSYATNIFADYSGYTKPSTSTSVSATQPVMIYGYSADTGVKGCAGTSGLNITYGSVSVSVRGTDYYNVSYLLNNLYTISITKNTYINSLYKIYGYSSYYMNESTYNKVSFNSTFEYNDGIYLNTTLASGIYTITVVNTTGVPGYVPPGEIPEIDPITHAGLLWNKNNYTLNEIGTLQYLADANFFDPIMSYWIDIVNVNNLNSIESFSGLGTSGSISYQFPNVGTFEAKYYRCTLFGCFTPESLGNAIVQVSKGKPSQLFPNATYYLGIKSNLSYYLNPFYDEDFFFYYWSADAGKYIPSYGKFSTPTGYGNISFNCGVATTYKITLDGAVAFTKCVSDNTKAGFNITTSFLNISSSTPNLLDYLYIEYGVDSVSWIGNYTVIKNYDKNGINVFTYPVGKQYDTIPFFLVYTPHEFHEMVVSTGINTIQLETESGIILATKTITVSEINDNGYGLIFDKNVFCSNEKISYKYYAVNDVNISLWQDEKFISKGFLNASVTGRKAYFIHEKTGVYDVRLMWGGTQFANGIITINSCVIPEEDTWVAHGGTATTCGFWDGWVGNLAGGQGINDLTRFMFALVVIGMITAFVAIITKNLGAGIIVGFFPYAFFVFLSLSTPCGQYMPVWTAVFIALIVGIKMRWF